MHAAHRSQAGGLFPAGNRVAVVLDLETYRQLLEAQEELEDIRAYDEAKTAGDETIPFDQALAEIEAERAQRKAS